MKLYDKTRLFALLAAVCLLSGCGKTAPAPVPTAAPTLAPTAEPTAVPTPEPTAVPTAAPTSEPTPEPTAVPTEAPAATPTAAPTPVPGPTATPVAPGKYTYASENGDWVLQLRDSGLFTLIDPDGAPHTGEGWSTGGDGIVTCGPTDIYTAPFAYDGGCSRWTVEGETCRPVARP